MSGLDEKADVRGWLKYWSDGNDIIERCLRKATAGKFEDAPFGFDPMQASAWHEAQANAYRHALEMMGIPSASGPTIRAYLASATPADVGEEPVAWRWKQIGRTDADAWSYQFGHPQMSDTLYVTEPVYSATALERVVMERDEALRSLVSAWNAFGPPAKRTEQPAFDIDDLDHLPLSACGDLAEQIVQIEDSLADAEAKLAEARKVQQAKDAAYWSMAEQCANLETDLTALRTNLETMEADRAAQAERMARLEEELVEQIMREEWDEICRDTGCHPLDITRQGRKLFFHPSHWAAAIARRLSEETKL